MLRLLSKIHEHRALQSHDGSGKFDDTTLEDMFLTKGGHLGMLEACSSY